LHYKKVGIVDVELNRLEEVLHGLLLCPVAVDEVLACAPKHDLPSHGYLSILLEANGRLLLVTIVEDNGNAGFGDARLTPLVY